MHIIIINIKLNDMLTLPNRKIKFFAINNLDKDDIYTDINKQKILDSITEYDFGICVNSSKYISDFNQIPIYTFSTEPYHRVLVSNTSFKYEFIFAHIEKIVNQEAEFIKWMITELNNSEITHFYFITSQPIFKYYVTHTSYVKKLCDLLLNNHTNISMITTDGDYYQCVSYHTYYLDRIRKLNIILLGSGSEGINQPKIFRNLSHSNFCNAAYNVVKIKDSPGYVIFYSDLLQHHQFESCQLNNIDIYIIHSIIKYSNQLDLIITKILQLDKLDQPTYFILNNREILQLLNKLELYEEYSDEYDSLQQYLDQIHHKNPIILYQKQQFIINIPDKLLSVKNKIKDFIIDKFGVDTFVDYLNTGSWNLDDYVIKN